MRNCEWKLIIIQCHLKSTVCFILTLHQSCLTFLLFLTLSLYISISLSLFPPLSLSLSHFDILSLFIFFADAIYHIMIIYGMLFFFHSGLGKQHIGGPVVIFAYYGNLNFIMYNFPFLLQFDFS